MGKVICVNIQKGGCGKTTTVQALGEMLSKRGKILSIDTDPQCNLTTASGINSADLEHTLYELLKKECTIEQAIIKSKYYDIIPGSLMLCSADSEFTKTGKEFLLKERLAPIREQYDFILIDTPPALNTLNIMSLTAADYTLIPLEPSDFALQGIAQLYDAIKTVKQYCNQNLDILGLLLVMYNDRTNLNKSVLEGIKEMADSMETVVFKTKIRECVKIKEAQLQQLSLKDWKYKDNKAILDYKEFSEELLKECN